MSESFNGFSQEQRIKLKTAFGRKYSKKEAAVDAFISDVEQSLNNLLNPVIQDSGLSQKEERKETENIYKHAHALRLAFERMSERERLSVSSVAHIVMKVWDLGHIPQNIKVYLQDQFSNLLITLLLIVERMASDWLEVYKPKKGPDKSKEYSLLVSIALDYSRHLGKPSSSPNGTLMGFVKLLGNEIGMRFGEDLLQSAASAYAHGYWMLETKDGGGYETKFIKHPPS